MHQCGYNQDESLVFIDETVAGKGAFIYYSIVEGVGACRSRDPIEDYILESIENIKRRIGKPESLSEDPIIRSYRRFLWKLGIDPTKTRPSSEALARRMLRGRGFPRVNDIVDLANAVSLAFLVPIGLYDLNRVEAPVYLRLSSGGEVFHPIGGEPKALSGGIPVLVDSKGAVLHIYPHRDSIHSMIRDDTAAILIVAAGVEGVPEGIVERAAREVCERLVAFGCAESCRGPWKASGPR